jgi:hypothetical protein
LLTYFFDPEDGGDAPPKRRLTLNGLHSVISQKMILCITTTVKTSNPIYHIYLNMRFGQRMCTTFSYGYLERDL